MLELYSSLYILAKFWWCTGRFRCSCNVKCFPDHVGRVMIPRALVVCIVIFTFKTLFSEFQHHGATAFCTCYPSRKTLYFCVFSAAVCVSHFIVHRFCISQNCRAISTSLTSFWHSANKTPLFIVRPSDVSSRLRGARNIVPRNDAQLWANGECSAAFLWMSENVFFWMHFSRSLRIRVQHFCVSKTALFIMRLGVASSRLRGARSVVQYQGGRGVSRFGQMMSAAFLWMFVN